MNNLLLTQQMAPSERVTNLEASTTWAFYLNDTLPRIIRVSLKEFIFQASSQGYGTLRGLWQLTLRLLMSYIYGAPSKARNADVVYIWTYVWQR